MSKSAFLDMLKSSSDKARTRETNEKQKDKVIYVNLLMKPSQLRVYLYELTSVKALLPDKKP